MANRTTRKTNPKNKDAPKKKDGKDDESTTLDATIRLRDIEIAQLLDRLKIKLDYKIGGKITVEAAVAVPLAGALDSSAYQFSGGLTSRALQFEGLTVRDFAARMTYQNGKFSLRN